MPDAFPAGAPCWIELSSSDVEASRAFYGALLGWTSDDPNPEFGGYVNFISFGENEVPVSETSDSVEVFNSYEVVGAFSYGTRLSRNWGLGTNF